ncbi:MAG TPA: GNAT family protein [Gemmatimonadaceae bacterium]|nr:GNAT family protein [Gemmatimonadaceae bacterium]
MIVSPCTLAGVHVRLEPLEVSHADELLEVALEPELWRFTTKRIDSPEALRVYLETAMAERDACVSLPFITREATSGRAVGSTRFLNISRHDRRVEIGWTWIGKRWQRTAANTEAKYLMLRHAFETWECVRVELKTSTLNEKSRAAIKRIGGVEEGIFRRHMRNADGTWRDTVYFSIIDREWPDVKRRLEERLAR